MAQELLKPAWLASSEWRGANGQRRRRRAVESMQSDQEAPSAEQFVLSVRSLCIAAYVPKMSQRAVGIKSSISD